jgi:hypothetical protein
MSEQRFTAQDGVTLKEYFESRLAAIEKAVGIAHQSMEARLLSMNEFRASLRDQSMMFVTKAEHDALCDRVDRLDKEVQGLRESRAELAGKASQSSVDNAKIMAFVGIGIGIVGILLKFVG